MHLEDTLRMATETLRGQRRRTALSLTGVAIGVASVLVLTALGQGARGYVVGQFGGLGASVLAVVPGKVETTGGIPGFGGVPNDLTLADARALRRGLPGVRDVVPLSIGNETAARGERSRQVAVLGATSGLLELRDLELRSGQFLSPGDFERGAPVVVLGDRLARELFPAENPVGEIVRLGGWRMRVVGTLAAQGARFGLNTDELAIVPVAVGLRLFDRRSLFRVLVDVRRVDDLPATKRRIADILIGRHGEEDFTLVTPDAILASLAGILDVLTLALAGIAAVSLAVAGIGIMNVMLVAVSERTSEVGLLKAVGALPRQITGLFLAEAALLSGAGGAAGLLLGHALVQWAARAFPTFPAAAPLWASAAAFATAVAVGLIFGVLPARRATRLDAVQALAGR